MANRSRRLNPGDAQDLGRDIDDVVHGSGSAIDEVYKEYRETDREIANLEAMKLNLAEDGRKVPGKLRVFLAESKLRLRELDRRIARHGEVMLGRVKRRMEIIKASPGAAFNKQYIRDVEKAVFRLEKKVKNSGVDIRTDLGRIMGYVLTLEQDSGIVIRKPGKKVDEVSLRKAKEAELYASLVSEWKKVHRYAKNDPRVQEDVEWVSVQIRALDQRFRRGESVRRGIERVAKRIMDIHNRTKPRKELKTYAQAQGDIAEFVGVIRKYSQGTVTPPGIDSLQRELETLSRRFPSSAKSQWKKEDARKFATDLSSLRKALDSLRPKRGRKNNPCVGLHFHGNDADDLMKALEESASRQSSAKCASPRDSNPNAKRAKKRSPSVLLIDRCQRLWEAYCEKATKKNLKAVLEHLEKMKDSRSEKVKKERSSCLRVANKEARRLKVK